MVKTRCKSNIECKTYAIHGYDMCKAHGGGKRCKEPECKASAIGKTKYCISHGGGLRCPNCKDWPDSRSGCKKYDGYCARVLRIYSLMTLDLLY